MFDAKQFIEKSLPELKAKIGGRKAIVAISGGVDSTVSALLVNRAIGASLLCVFIDTGFMREGEPEKVGKMLEGLGINLRVVDARERFISVVEGKSDAEEKRKAFRSTFYSLFGEIVKGENAQVLVQGTIAPDWIETKGGIKSQHNVLAQIGINSETEYGYEVVEPLLELYKDQVRAVGKELRMPEEMHQRQPFPGPGLLVRIVGEVRRDKLEATRKSCAIAEKYLASVGAQQYFAVVIEKRGEPSEKMRKEASEAIGGKCGVKVLEARATGVKGDMRVYGNIAVVDCPSKANAGAAELHKLQFELIGRNPQLTRVIWFVSGRTGGEYICALRAVKTRDFMTAECAEVGAQILSKCAEEILAECPEISDVCYDITPKPPATVEYE
ncbi:MAG: GMP synthase [Candidatus Micrarchaeota archaeon]|nr:GMP synthase [Candidatus Micrarchaeota archaeon]